MALNAGTETSHDGLTQEIFDNLKAKLSPALEASGADMTEVYAGWQKLSNAIAEAVVTHLKNNLEIKGITVSGGRQNNDGIGHVN
jgi:hypothetical protein